MVRKDRFWRHIGYERRQLEVNGSHELESYAGTCYHAQQFSEKMMKQKLEDFGAKNKNTHNLSHLANNLAFLSGTDLESAENRFITEACQNLTQWYGESRYPSDDEEVEPEVTLSMARVSMQYAHLIADWVDSLVVPTDPYGVELVKQRVKELEEKESQERKKGRRKLF